MISFLIPSQAPETDLKEDTSCDSAFRVSTSEAVWREELGFQPLHFRTFEVAGVELDRAGLTFGVANLLHDTSHRHGRKIRHACRPGFGPAAGILATVEDVLYVRGLG